MAKALVVRGHKVSIILPPYDNIRDAGRSYKYQNINIYNVSLSQKPIFCLGHLAIAGALVSHTVKLQPDIIHVFKPKGYSGLACTILTLLQRLRLLSAARVILDVDDWEGYGGWNDILDYTQAEKLFFQLQEVVIPRFTDAVTVATYTLYRRMIKFGVRGDKIYYIPNGPNQLRYSPSEELNRYDKYNCSKHIGLHQLRNLNQNTKIILLYTRFTETSIVNLTQLFKQILAKFKNVTIHGKAHTPATPTLQFLIVGNNRRFDACSKLRALAKLSRLDHLIIFTGWVSPSELPYYLRCADVAIYPAEDTAINRAKCSAKLIELMHFGLPIVATDVGDVSKYIESGVSGILVPPGDPERFATAVVCLLKNKYLQQKLGANARAQVWSKFSWDDKLVLEVEAAYTGS
jgi:glycosyltransferase involved in cell wall biosynthesis